MKILVDGDSCNKLLKIEQIAATYNVKVILFSAHSQKPGRYEVHYVGKGKDEADFALVKYCEQDDIVVTRDTGLAEIVLAKKARAINPNGVIFTSSNVSYLSDRRHIRKECERETNRESIKGMGRIQVERQAFGKGLVELIKQSNANML